MHLDHTLEGRGGREGGRGKGREKGSGGGGWSEGGTYGGEAKGVNYRGGRREEEECRERGVSENATYAHQRHYTHSTL